MVAKSRRSAKPYNWHPLVHKQHFDEKLYFAMVRLKDPLHVPVAEQIRTLLESVGIKYACEYTLYGYHDALVRVWLKEPAYERFIEVLPPGARGFTADHIYYLWRSTNDLLSADADVLTKMAGASDDIDTVAQEPNITDTTSWSKLDGLKLVFDRPSTGRGVKFYTLLERTSDTVAPSEQVAMIVEALNRTLIPKRNLYMSAYASLYCGKGDLATDLVRCIAPTYHDVLTLVEQFDINLKEARVRPMTLLVANRRPREFDHPNDPLHLSLDDRNLAERLSVDPRIINDLNDHHLIELRKLEREACKIAGDDEVLCNVLPALLRATVLNNKVAWYQSIIFLAHFEPLFGKCVEQILELEVGKGKWRAQIKERCKASSNPDWLKLATEMDKKKRLWSLGNYKFLARAAAEFYPAVDGQLINELGAKWEKEIDSIHELRNTHLHGRNYEQQLNVYDEKWTSELRRIVNAAVLWRRLGGGEDRG